MTAITATPGFRPKIGMPPSRAQLRRRGVREWLGLDERQARRMATLGASAVGAFGLLLMVLIGQGSEQAMVERALADLPEVQEEASRAPLLVAETTEKGTLSGRVLALPLWESPPSYAIKPEQLSEQDKQQLLAIISKH